ncbi:hypothetical protein SOV_07890 [Sporomusa ovata DSM 2662]|nr:hypothetical protein SOV_1c01270 [Sporomusa ovata DSM 2662]
MMNSFPKFIVGLGGAVGLNQSRQCCMMLVSLCFRDEIKGLSKVLLQRPLSHGC